MNHGDVAPLTRTALSPVPSSRTSTYYQNKKSLPRGSESGPLRPHSRWLPSSFSPVLLHPHQRWHRPRRPSPHLHPLQCRGDHSCGRCARLYSSILAIHFFSSSNLIMGPPDPPANFLPTHVVLRVTPRPFSSAPMGFIQDNGTAFMSQYLMPLASLPGTVPSLLVRLEGIPYGQQAAPLAAIYDLGGATCVPGGSALRAPAPHDTTFTGPCCPDPEEDISGLPLHHGV